MTPADASKEGVLCLQCQQRVRGPFFCEACGGICEAGEAADYFSYFGIARTLTPDRAALERKFYELSNRLHPDRFAARSPREREASEAITSRLNQAYRCLKDPVGRAAYLVEVEGLTMAGEGRVPAELAEEYFELQEARDSDPAALPGLKKRLESRREALQKEFARDCREWKRGDHARLKAIAANLNAQNYLGSMLRDMEGKK